MASIVPIIRASSSEVCHSKHKCRPVAMIWKQCSTLQAWQHGNCALNYFSFKELETTKICDNYTGALHLCKAANIITLLKQTNKQKIIFFSSLHNMHNHISPPSLLLCFPYANTCHRNQSSLISRTLNNANYWRQKFTFLHSLHAQFKWVPGRCST